MPAADHFSRLSKFKNNSRLEESRRKRSETTIELRKMKKDVQLLKRRNINLEQFHEAPRKEEIVMDLDEMVISMESTNPDIVLEAVQSCRKVLSRQHNPPIDIMVEKGIVPKCIQYLTYMDRPSLQFEAAWVLTNIASGTKQQTKVVIDSGAVPALIKLLESNHMNVIEQAVWALGNIAGDGPEGRNAIFDLDPMPALVRLCSAEATLSLIKNTVWTISNLCRCKDSDKIDRIKPALRLLKDLLMCEEKDVIADACWSWSYITDGTNEKIQLCIEANIVPHLVKKLESTDPSILTPVLRAIGNIVTGTDTQTDIVINCGALKHLKNLLFHERRNLVKESAWTISNITAGNKSQIQSIIDAGLVSPLLDVMRNADPKSSKEAAYAIMNITTGGSVEQIAFLVQSGVFTPLCELLDSPDSQVTVVVMDTLTNILKIAEQKGELDTVALMIEECEGLDKIEHLQHHENNLIYQKAVAMIDTFFSTGEGVDENLAPTVTGTDGETGQLQFKVADDTSVQGFRF